MLYIYIHIYNIHTQLLVSLFCLIAPHKFWASINGESQKCSVQNGKSYLEWMIWGYPPFTKPPRTKRLSALKSWAASKTLVHHGWDLAGLFSASPPKLEGNHHLFCKIHHQNQRDIMADIIDKRWLMILATDIFSQTEPR